jgi:hypothetical protein
MADTCPIDKLLGAELASDLPAVVGPVQQGLALPRADMSDRRARSAA